MRRFANIYIALFLLDAGLSLVDELLNMTGFSTPLLANGRLLAGSVLIMVNMLIFACLGIDRRLPKRVLLPMVLYVFWSSVAMWPLSGAIGRDTLPLIAAIGQVALGLLTIAMLRGRIFLPEELFRGRSFSLRNTLGFTAINLLLLPLVVVYSVLAIASTYLEEQTAGFLRLSPVGIYMSERDYHLDEKVVRLTGMMHIGREDYYQELAASVASGNTIILAEGVTDQNHLLTSRFNYGQLAGVIGLTSQDKMIFDGNLIDLADLGQAKPDNAEQLKPDIARADIDLKDFEPQTLEFLNMLGRTLFSGMPLLEGLAEYNDWAQEKMTDERVAAVMTDILDKRNRVVIDSLELSLVHYDTVVIPWGAMHMPAIETAVLAQGFVPGVKRERLSLDFRMLPYAELWQKWSAYSSLKMQDGSS